MTIEELKAERRIVEDQLEQLKKQYDRVDSEVNLHGWRQMTPEEKKLEAEYTQKQKELDRLIFDQIKRVIASENISLIEDYYYEMPKKYDELKILFFSHKRFREGQMTDILKKYINYGFLLGVVDNPYVSRDDFDNAMAMFGPDGIKIEYLNSMLEIESTETQLDTLEIREHILKTIAGFSSPEIAIELFRCIFKPENMNSIIREGLCEKFASLIEQYQELRKKYDVEVLESDNRMINFDRYYLINFRSFHNKLITLPEESRRIIEDLSLENAERVRQKIKPKPLDKEEIIRVLLSKYGVIEEDVPNSEMSNENLSIASIIDQIIADNKKDIDKEPKPSVVSAPVANEEIAIVQGLAEPIFTRKISKLPNPVRIVRRTEQNPVSSNSNDYQRLIEQRKEERGIETGLSEEETKEQDYQKFKRAILDIMDPNNSKGKSVEELAALISNNPNVIYYETKYGNKKNNDSQPIETPNSPYIR